MVIDHWSSFRQFHAMCKHFYESVGTLYLFLPRVDCVKSVEDYVIGWWTFIKTVMFGEWRAYCSHHYIEGLLCGEDLELRVGGLTVTFSGRECNGIS